jgi:hypothetical protein
MDRSPGKSATTPEHEMSSQTRLKGKEKEQREVFLSEKNSYSLNAGLPFFPYSKIEKNTLLMEPLRIFDRTPW